MEERIFSRANFGYWLYTIIAVSLTTLTAGRILKRQENVRWTMGWAIVFLPGSIMVYRRHWDGHTWAGLFFSVGLAGAIKVGAEQLLNSIEAERLRNGQTRG